MTSKTQNTDLAPETHNSEQDDHLSQAQEVSKDAQGQDDSSPTDSIKPKDKSGDGDSTQDLIDHMRDMEQSGRIDMDAYRGEPNMDDNEDELGEANKLDPKLTFDGS